MDENRPKLVMADGTEINLCPSSTITSMTAIVDSWDKIPPMHINKENVEGGTFNDEAIDGLFTGVTITMHADGDFIMVVINTRAKTEMELIHEKQDMHTAILNDLIMGGE